LIQNEEHCGWIVEFKRLADVESITIRTEKVVSVPCTLKCLRSER